MSDWARLALTIGLPLLALATSIVFTLHVMPAEEYAEVMVGGRQLADSLIVVSHHIEDTARLLWMHGIRATDTRELLWKTGWERSDRDSVKWRRRWTPVRSLRLWLMVALPATVSRLGYNRPSRQDYVRWAVQAVHRDLLRIDAILNRIGHDHQIPQHKLRDSLVFFDPDFFSHSAHSLLNNLEILDQAECLGEYRDEVLRSDAIGSIELARRTCEFQRQLQEYTAIVPHAARLASVSSLSLAAQRFARAVQFIARKTIEEYDSIPESATSRAARLEVLQDGFTALSLISWQSRSHLGVCVRRTCCSINQASIGLRKLSRLVSPVAPAEYLESSCIPSYANKAHASNIDRRGEPDPFSPRFWCKLHRNVGKGGGEQAVCDILRDLCTVEEGTWNTIEAHRQSIIKAARRRYQSWSRALPSSFNHILVVTHGFSATVRHVLLNEITLAQKTQAVGGDGARRRLSIQVVSAGGSNAHEGRQLANLARHRSFRLSRRPVIFSSNTEAILNASDENTAVLLLLGAELFDEAGYCITGAYPVEDIIRCVLEGVPGRAGAPVVRFTGKLQGRDQEHLSHSAWVLAEEYKRTSSIHLPLRSYCHHINHLSVIKAQGDSVVLVTGTSPGVEGDRAQQGDVDV